MTDKTPALPEPSPLDEVYDTQMEVERDPCGAWQAIQTLSAQLQEAIDRAERAEKESERLTKQCHGLYEAAMNNGQDLLRKEAALADARKDNERRQQNMRDQFEALCAMRNDLNEMLPIQHLEADLRDGPDTSVFCAKVVEAVRTAIAAAEVKPKVKPLVWYEDVYATIDLAKSAAQADYEARILSALEGE